MFVWKSPPDHSGTAEHPVEGGLHLGGEAGRRSGGEHDRRAGPGGPYGSAGAAFHLSEPADQRHGPAPGAGVEFEVVRPLAVGADQHLGIVTDAALPRADAADRVRLPGPAAVAGHRLLRSGEVGECLEVVGDVSRLADRVDHRPADHAVAVDDEGPPAGDALLLVEDTVRPSDLSVWPEIGEKRESVALLVRPRAQREERVDGDGEQLRVGRKRAQRRQLTVTDPAESQREEDQHDSSALELGQPDRAAMLVLKLEIRSGRADLGRMSVHTSNPAVRCGALAPYRLPLGGTSRVPDQSGAAEMVLVCERPAVMASSPMSLGSTWPSRPALGVS